MYQPQMQACYGGRELFHMCRVLHYANDQLGHFVSVSGSSSKEASDCCGCQCCDDTFTDPATDDVCWYDAAYPESGQFLGLLPTEINGMATGATVRSNRPLRYGDMLTRRRVRGRELRIVGWLLGTSRAGIDWGYRWLAQTLKRDCGPERGSYSFWLDCEDIEGELVAQDQWTLKRVGLVDGPTVLDEFQSFPNPCYARQVEFTFHAEIPWLWQEPEIEVTPINRVDTLTVDPSVHVYNFRIPGPAPGFIRVPRIIIDNSRFNVNTHPVFVTGAPLSWMGNDGAGCPPNRVQRPPVGIGIVANPGERILIDGVTRQFYHLNDNNCIISIADNIGLMDGSAGFWADIDPCEEWCFGVWTQDAAGDNLTYPAVTATYMDRADG